MSITSNKTDYILGINNAELDRLKFQHEVWKDVTDNFIYKINIQKGWECLDIGAGPGFVSLQLLEEVGAAGKVTALEPAKFYLDYFKEECKKRKIENVNFIDSSIENTDLKQDHYDLIFVRWVIDFLPDAENILIKLLRSLKTGGVIAIQDYVYEGISLFPKGGSFDKIIDYVRKYYIAGGGDPFFTVKIPRIFKDNNITLNEYSPVSKAGGNESGVFKWAYLFFTGHLKYLTELKIINSELEKDLLEDLNSHADNPDMIFFSPVIVNIIGQKN